MNFRTKFKLLIITNMICITSLLLITFSGFKNQDAKKYFKEIDAQRINIMGANGKPIMVLSNKELIPGPSMNGKDYPRELADGRQHLSGIVFFNEEGDEVGGLLYNGFKKDSGYSAVGHFSLDQWKQNQVVALQYLDNNKSRRAGLRVWDRPATVGFDSYLDLLKAHNDAPVRSRLSDSLRKLMQAAVQNGETGVERLFIGSQDEVAQIQLKDKKGKVRAKLYISESGEAKLDFFSDKGELLNSFPGK